MENPGIPRGKKSHDGAPEILPEEKNSITRIGSVHARVRVERRTWYTLPGLWTASGALMRARPLSGRAFGGETALWRPNACSALVWARVRAPRWP